MNQSMNADPFQNTKLQILKQKYEYMTHYMAETENRVAQVRMTNRKLKARVEELEDQKFAPMNERN
jgi:hypothetical protein